MGKYIWIAVGKHIFSPSMASAVIRRRVYHTCIQITFANTPSTVPIYWGGAFVIAAAVPQIANLTAFVGAACILQFSYTFPRTFLAMPRLRTLMTDTPQPSSKSATTARRMPYFPTKNMTRRPAPFNGKITVSSAGCAAT